MLYGNIMNPSDLHGLTELYISKFRKTDVLSCNMDFVILIQGTIGLPMVVFTFK